MEPLVQFIMDSKLREAWSAQPDSPVVPDSGPSRWVRLSLRAGGLIQLSLIHI